MGARLWTPPPGNALDCRDGPLGWADARHGRLRWIHDIDFSRKEDGSLTLTAIEQKETRKGIETRYAWISDVTGINRGNVKLLVESAGRKRHSAEDHLNVLKNNGFGMEHVYCADATGSKNIYSLMQIAYIMWTLFHHGLLRRICDWAEAWSQLSIAKCLMEGLRLLGGADPDFKVGQLRLVEGGRRRRTCRRRPSRTRNRIWFNEKTVSYRLSLAFFI